MNQHQTDTETLDHGEHEHTESAPEGMQKGQHMHGKKKGGCGGKHKGKHKQGMHQDGQEEHSHLPEQAQADTVPA